MELTTAPQLVERVYAHHVRDIFRRNERETTAVGWHRGMVAGDLPCPRYPCLEVLLNGRSLPRDEWRDQPICANDHVYFAQVPGDLTFTAWVLIILVVDALTGSHLMRFIGGFLAPPLDARKDDDNRGTYGWNGPFTNYSPAGQPEPMLLGKHRVGGQVLAQYIEVIDGQAPESFVNILIMVSNGPIEAIGQYKTDQDNLFSGSLPDGMQINGNNAVNFDDVTCHLRMGTLTQTAMSGFTFIPTEYTVGLLIDNTKDGDGLPAVSDWSMAAVFDFPAGQQADRTIVTLQFPGGLFRVNAAGVKKTATVDIEIRYIELDGAGLPIGNYVTLAGLDGFQVTAKNQSPFSKQINVTHFDPETFTSPTTGGQVYMNGVGKNVRLAVRYPNATVWPTGWRTPTNRIPELTFSAFLTLRTDAKDRHPVWAICDWDGSTVGDGTGIQLLTGNVDGMMVLLEQIDSESYGVTVMMGDGLLGPQMPIIRRVGTVEKDFPFFLAVTYKESAVGNLNRVRVFIDGVIVWEELTGTDLVVTGYTPVPPTNLLGMVMNVTPTKEGTGFADQWRANLNWDEVRIYQAEKTPGEISSLHNSFQWLTIESFGVEAIDPNLVTAWNMDVLGGPDAAQTSQHTMAAFHPPALWDPIHVFATSPPLELTGVVDIPAPFNNVKRARWRIEVQRTDKVQEDTTHHDTVNFQSVTAILDEVIGYRQKALVGLRIKATDQLSSSFPRVTFIVRGVKSAPVWDGVDPDSPNLIPSFSRNPAWQLAYLYLEKERGAGHIYDASNIDWPSFKVWADYCDVLVYDMHGKFGAPHGDTGLSFEKNLLSITLDVEMDKPTPGHFFARGLITLDQGKLVRISGGTHPDIPSGDFEIVSIQQLQARIRLSLADIGQPGTSGPTFNPVIGDATAVCIGLEPRIECDIVFDERGISFLDARGFLTTVGRARIVNFGDRVTAIVDQERQPVAAFNAANIIAGTFIMSSVSTGARFNTAVAEIQNEEKDYARDPIPLDHESLTDESSTLDVRRTTFDFRGVTRESQTLRELRLHLNRSNLIHRSCKFGTALDGFFLDVGDVFVLAHPVPHWDSGGRCLTVSPDTSSVVIDHDIIIGQPNFLAQSKDLTDSAVWNLAGGSPPIINPTPVPDNLGDLLAWHVTFPQSSVLTQVVANRGNGSQYTFVFWMRHVLGNASDIGIEFFTSGQIPIATVQPTVTSTWNRFVVTGTTTQPYTGNEDITVRFIRGTVAGVVEVEIAWPRFILGADDGLDADGTSRDATGPIPTHYIAVSDAADDAAVSFKSSLIKAGKVLAGTIMRTSATLGFLPQKEFLWFVGPEAYGARPFEVLQIAPDPQEMSVEIQAIEVNTAVYPDEDDWPTLNLPSGSAGQSSLEQNEGALPEPAGFIQVTEESGRDSVTGSLLKAINVTWSKSGTDARSGNADRYRIWLQEIGQSAAAELMGEVSGSETIYRISAGDLDVNTQYEVKVQPISRQGLRLGLKRASGKRFTYHGLHEPPGAPGAVRALLHGEMATYEADLPVGFQAAVVELFRGGTFVGQSIGRIPVGGSHFGPTTDWCVLNPAADLRKDAPVFARLSTNQGSRGPRTEVSGTLVPAGYTDLLADSMEDGPWDAAGTGYIEVPILTSLVRESVTDPPGSPDRLIFTGSSLTGSYESTIYDLTRPRLTHVSFAVFGAQVTPDTLASLPPLGALRTRSWSPEGYLDPGHASYGKVDVVLLWAHSDSAADPGTAYERFRCGPHYFRSCRFKIQVTRPTDLWDVHITRAAVVIRNPPHSTDIDGGGA